MPVSRIEITSSRVFDARVQRDLAFRIGVLGGIGEEVADHLRQAQRIGLELHAPCRQVDGELMLFGIEQRTRGLDCDADDGLEIDVVLLELELASRDARHVEQVIEQQRHALHLAGNDLAPPFALPVVGRVRIEYAHGIADGREWIAQLMRQRGEEFVLAAVGLEQRALGVLQAADVEIDAGPALDAPGLVADGHALREDGVVFAVDAHHAVLAVPVGAGARGFLPRGHRVLDIVGVEDAAPAVVGRLMHREADEFEERIAGVDAAPVSVGDPHAVVDGLADGAVQLFAGLERARMRLHFVEHLVERVDDHADLVVGHLLGAERVVALLDDGLATVAMDSIGRLTTRCSHDAASRAAIRPTIITAPSTLR